MWEAGMIGAHLPLSGSEKTIDERGELMRDMLRFAWFDAAW